MADLDLETIRHALQTAHEGGFSEVRLELGDSAFSASLANPDIAAQKHQPELNGSLKEAIKEPDLRLKPIAATCVGFYKPSDSVLRVGQRVHQGDIVATITALGLANDVESPVSGEIIEVLATPEQPVEYGQPLVVVRED
jgi:acetyl-CoA carboxylase biotin carboxyl carrier protein